MFLVMDCSRLLVLPCEGDLRNGDKLNAESAMFFQPFADPIAFPFFGEQK